MSMSHFESRGDLGTTLFVFIHSWKGSLYIREVELEDLELVERDLLETLYSSSFSQLHFTLELITREVEHCTRLAIPRCCLDGSHVEWLRQALGQNPKRC